MRSEWREKKKEKKEEKEVKEVKAMRKPTMPMMPTPMITQLMSLTSRTWSLLLPLWQSERLPKQYPKGNKRNRFSRRRRDRRYSTHENKSTTNQPVITFDSSSPSSRARLPRPPKPRKRKPSTRDHPPAINNNNIIIEITNNDHQIEIARPKSFAYVINAAYTIKYPIQQISDVLAVIEEEKNAAIFCNVFESRKPFAQMKLCDDSLCMLNLPNAGGSSIESEVLSIELLQQCFGARLLKTEMEIEYFPEESKKTDYSVMINNKHIGVSVTRAMKFRGEFTALDAQILLQKKLYGIIVSSENVVSDKWSKQILHIWATHKYIANILKVEFEKLDKSLKLNTVVIITVSSHLSSHANIFIPHSNLIDTIYPPEKIGADDEFIF